MTGLLAVVAVYALVCGLFGYDIGERKDLGLMGFLLGLFFGPFGLIVIAVMERGPVPGAECPFCCSIIEVDASICRYCFQWMPGDEDESGEAVAQPRPAAPRKRHF